MALVTDNVTTAAVDNSTGSTFDLEDDQNWPNVNVTVPWLVRPTDDETSECEINVKYGVVYGLVAAMCILFGILYTFFGYRFFKAVMFLTGFIFGAVLLYMIFQEQALLPPEGNLGVAIGAGVLLGLITMLVQHVGLFLTGVNLGVAAAIMILVVVEQFTHPPVKWIPIGLIASLGIVLGIVCLRFQKQMTMIGTSVFGAALILAGLDYFVELSRMALYIWDRVKAAHSAGLCWYSWVVVSLWPVLAFAGTIIQWRVTSIGVDHKIVLRSRSEQGANLQQARARQSRETQQTRYRHLYQARRVKGDVISQNFLQTIHHKLSPAMQSLTALNTEPVNEEESTVTTTLTQVT